MVRGPVDGVIGFKEPPEGLGEVPSLGVEDREVKKPGGMGNCDGVTTVTTRQMATS